MEEGNRQEERQKRDQEEGMDQGKNFPKRRIWIRREGGRMNVNMNMISRKVWTRRKIIDPERASDQEKRCGSAARNRTRRRN